MKPVKIEYKFGIIIGGIIVLLALFNGIEKIDKIYKFITPSGDFLNWNFFITLIIVSCLILWYIMNYFWHLDYVKNQELKFEVDNLTKRVEKYEKERLTDLITGVPNSLALKKDIDEHYKYRFNYTELQFIFIDFKGFGKLNTDFGFIKTNEVMRYIAQTVYQSMRRNEEMYKYPIDKGPEANVKESIYRVHTGGDEFAFIIEGDQTSAVGFANRLLKQFNNLTDPIKKILGKEKKISFYCAISKIDPNDDYENMIRKIKEGYRLAKAGKKDFSICWDDIKLENSINKSDNKFKKSIYQEAHEQFDVMTQYDVNPI